jgi:uncharacterized protein
MKKGPIIFVVVVGIFVIANLIWVDRKYDLEEPALPQSQQIEYVNLGGAVVKVEVVSTLEDRTLGLSGRESLPENTGMLFVFPENGEHLFWMKDMKFSIDIIWISEDGRVVYIKENAAPESFPEVFKPEGNARYVLEVPAGFAAKNNIKTDSGVEFVLK